MNSDSTLIPACNDDRFLAVPGRVVCHDLGVRCDVLRGKLGKLIGLSVNPAKWLHFLQTREQKEITESRTFSQRSPWGQRKEAVVEGYRYGEGVGIK